MAPTVRGTCITRMRRPQTHHQTRAPPDDGFSTPIHPPELCYLKAHTLPIPCRRLHGELMQIPERNTAVVCGSRHTRRIPVPRPSLPHGWVEQAIQHLDDILAQDGEELEAVKGATGGDEQVPTGRVGGDDKVPVWGQSLPVCTRYASDQSQQLALFLFPEGPWHLPADAELVPFQVLSLTAKDCRGSTTDIILQGRRHVPLVIVHSIRRH